MMRRLSALALLWMLGHCASIVGHAGEPKDDVWWSLTPVKRPVVPEGEEVNPIDRFIESEFGLRGINAHE